MTNQPIDPITRHINIANLTDLLIPSDHPLRTDADSDESLTNAIADHYNQNYPSIPLSLELIEFISHQL